MADSEKRFPPSDTKLRRLRADGVFPRSSTVLALGSLTGGAAAIALILSNYGGAVRALFAGSIKGRVASASDLSEFYGIFSGAGLLLTSVVAISVLVSGLLQNKFYLGFGRVFRPTPRLKTNSAGRLRAYFGGLCLALGVALISWWFITDATTYLNQTFLPLVIERKFRGASPLTLAELKVNFEAAMRLLLAVEVEVLRSRLSLLSETLLGALLFCAIIARIAVGIEFQREHGMTREELESEMLEGEVSPQLRDAQRQRSVENTEKLQVTGEPDNS